jgi:hypothetical protein
MRLKETNAVYTKNNMKHINKNADLLLIVKAGWT